MKQNAAQETQISAFISEDTRAMLDALVRETGVKKSHVLETALRHHLQALQELPADVIVPARILVSRASGARMLRRIRSGRPNAALRKLMSPRGS